MSIIVSSSLVLLLLVCCSLHACNARAFGVETAKINNKENEKLSRGAARVLITPDSKSSTPNATEKPMKHIPVKEYSGGATNESVSWKVPEKKRGEQEPIPGFNLDYLPPRTHPPVHN